MARRPFDTVLGMQAGLLNDLLRAAANASPAYPPTRPFEGIDWDCQLPSSVVTHDGAGSGVIICVMMPWTCQSLLMPWIREDGIDTRIRWAPGGVQTTNQAGQQVQSVGLVLNDTDVDWHFRVGSETETLDGTAIAAATATPLAAAVAITKANRIPQLLRLLAQTTGKDRKLVLDAAGPGNVALRRLLAAAQNLPDMVDDTTAKMAVIAALMTPLIGQQLRLPPIRVPSGAPNTFLTIPATTVVASADGPPTAATAVAFRCDLNLDVAGLPSPAPLAIDASADPIASPTLTLAGSLVSLSLGEELLENLVELQLSQLPPIAFQKDGFSVNIAISGPVGLTIGATDAKVTVQVIVTVDSASAVPMSIASPMEVRLQLAVDQAGNAVATITISSLALDKFIDSLVDAVDPLGPNILWKALVKLLAGDMGPALNTQLSQAAAPQVSAALNQTLATVGPSLGIPASAGFRATSIGFSASGWLTVRFAATTPAALVTSARTPRPGALTSGSIALAPTVVLGEPLPNTTTNLKILALNGPKPCDDGSPGQSATVEQGRLRVANSVQVGVTDPIFNGGILNAFGFASAPSQAAFPTYVVLTRSASLALWGSPPPSPIAPSAATGATLAFSQAALAPALQPLVAAIEAAHGEARVAALADAVAGGAAAVVVQSMLRNDLATLLGTAPLQLAALADLGKIATTNALLAPPWAALANDLAVAFADANVASTAMGSTAVQLSALHKGTASIVLCDGKPLSAVVVPANEARTRGAAGPVWRQRRIERIHLHPIPKPHPVPKLFDPPRE